MPATAGFFVVMDTGQIIGFIAAGLSCVAGLPHLMKSLRTGTQGVSSTAWWLAGINSGLWTTFAIMTHTYATLISSVANGIIAAVILYLVYAEKVTQEKEQEAEAELVAARLPSFPPRRSVAERLKQLDDREREVDTVFHELTRTLEMPHASRSDTGELIPV